MELKQLTTEDYSAIVKTKGSRKGKSAELRKVIADIRDNGQETAEINDLNLCYNSVNKLAKELNFEFKITERAEDKAYMLKSIAVKV